MGDPCPPIQASELPHHTGTLVAGAVCLQATALPSPRGTRTAVGLRAPGLCAAVQKALRDEDLPRVRAGQLDLHSSANNSE